jgi:hypothetical protein
MINTKKHQFNNFSSKKYFLKNSQKQKQKYSWINPKTNTVVSLFILI